MAGDWIKIEHSLPGKPEVMELARILSIDEMSVVGHLVCFWTWVDQNLSLKCPVASGTKRGLDRVAGRDGFTDAMVIVGWLKFDGRNVQIPNYDHHLSESAKKRSEESRRKRNQRQMSLKCPADVGTNKGQNMGPEKRREEKRRVNKEEEGRTDEFVISAIADPPALIPTTLIPYEDVRVQFDATFGLASRMTDKRRSALKARWLDEWWRDNWQAALNRGGQSAFLRGANDRNWVIDLEFFLRPDTATKILEGKYDNREQYTRPSGNSAAAREHRNADAFAIVEAAAAQYAASGSGRIESNGHGDQAAMCNEEYDGLDSVRY